MNTKNERTQSRPTVSPAPRQRFRIRKLEERIAPSGNAWGKKTRLCNTERGCSG